MNTPPLIVIDTTIYILRYTYPAMNILNTLGVFLFKYSNAKRIKAALAIIVRWVGRFNPSLDTKTAKSTFGLIFYGEPKHAHTCTLAKPTAYENKYSRTTLYVGQSKCAITLSPKRNYHNNKNNIIEQPH